jgi:hypothetical protein
MELGDGEKINPSFLEEERHLQRKRRGLTGSTVAPTACEGE